MLADLVDDDLLSGSGTVAPSTKTMLNMNNNGKFRDFESTDGIAVDNYIWNLTHVRCV